MGLEKLRREAGLSLHGLAAKSGVNYMKIHQIERGKINVENITIRVAQKLADALGCEPKDLMTPEEPAALEETETPEEQDNEG